MTTSCSSLCLSHNGGYIDRPLVLVLADKSNWGLFGASDLASDVLRNVCGFASFTIVDVCLDGALVSDADDRVCLAAVAHDTFVDYILLQLNSCLGSGDVELIDLLLELSSDLGCDQELCVLV